MHTSPLLDNNGYPTPHALNTIQNWTGTPEHLTTQILNPIFAPGAGLTIEDTTDFLNRPIKRVSLITGGWSGCETAINVIERSMYGYAYWESTHRGGLHIYNIPTTTWDQPMQALPDMRPLLPYDTRTVLDALMTAMNCNIDSDTGDCPTCGSAPCGPHPTYYWCNEHDWHDTDNTNDTCGYALTLARRVVHASANIPPRDTN